MRLSLLVLVLFASPWTALCEDEPAAPEGFRRGPGTTWIYPHTDGVAEVFSATKGPWRGSLGSVFDPAKASFVSRFNAVEVANELLANRTSSRGRRRAARLLVVYLAQHPLGRSGPAYLEHALKPIKRHVPRKERRVLEGHAAFLASVVAQAERPAAPRGALRSSDDHYRALIADGFFDVAVVAGNSRDEESGEHYSARLLDGLRQGLLGMGFVASAERGAPANTLYERSIDLLGQRVRARVRIAGGSKRMDETRRALGALVEGLARADVVLYVGHSNKHSGAYYLSERKTSYTRMRLGKDASDLARRCYSLGRLPYQILSLQSCSSFEKYCLPVRRHFDAQGLRAPGLIGTPEVSYFQEFVPRGTAFLKLLFRGAGPREIARTLHAIMPMPKSPLLLLRGVLQPRHAFLAPKGVRLDAPHQHGVKRGFLVVAREREPAAPEAERDAGAPDLAVAKAPPPAEPKRGKEPPATRYFDSGVFPQDREGDVVQVLPWAKGLLGLYRDGVVSWVGPDTGGASVEPHGWRTLRLTSFTRARFKGRDQLIGTDRQGRLVVLASDRSSWRLAHRQAPAPLAAIGSDGRTGLLGLTAKGERWRWTPRAGWKTAPRQTDPVTTPSLTGPGPRAQVTQPGVAH